MEFCANVRSADTLGSPCLSTLLCYRRTISCLSLTAVLYSNSATRIASVVDEHLVASPGICAQQIASMESCVVQHTPEKFG
jgi:hypothetical protein